MGNRDWGQQGSRHATEPWPGRDVLTPWARPPAERPTMTAPRPDLGWSEQVLHQGWGPGAERRAAARRDIPDVDDGSAFDDPDDWAPRRSPGTGFVLGLLGILAFVLSATVLPWIDTEAGRSVTLPDIRAAFDDRSVAVADTRGDLSPAISPGPASPDEAVAGAGVPAGETPLAAGSGTPADETATGSGTPANETATATGTPTGTTTAGSGTPANETAAATGTPTGATTAGSGTPANETAAATGTPTDATAAGTGIVADEAAAAVGEEDDGDEPGISTTQANVDRLLAALPAVAEEGRHDLIRWYSGPMWFASLVLATLAVAFATALVPVGRGRRVLTGLVLAGPVGVLANLADRRGAVGPRLSGLVAASCALAMHVAAVRDLDEASGASESALGPVVGAAALALVALACLIGSRAEPQLADA